MPIEGEAMSEQPTPEQMQALTDAAQNELSSDDVAATQED